MIIVHSLSVYVEQLCAQSADGPTLEQLRPVFCPACKCPAQNSDGHLQIVGHGYYARQVRGLSGSQWLVIWVRRFLCLVCHITISCLPDWIHPWRWYAATVIIEALCRYYLLGETSREVGARFGRSADELEWRSLRRWRMQLLISPTLWGWLGNRLGIDQPAGSRRQIASYLHRLLAEGNASIRTGIDWLAEVPTAVRRTLHGGLFRRRERSDLEHFPSGRVAGTFSGPKKSTYPTEKGSGCRAP